MRSQRAKPLSLGGIESFAVSLLPVLCGAISQSHACPRKIK